jgi:hypothetical protein
LRREGDSLTLLGGGGGKRVLRRRGFDDDVPKQWGSRERIRGNGSILDFYMGVSIYVFMRGCGQFVTMNETIGYFLTIYPPRTLSEIHPRWRKIHMKRSASSP